MIGRWYMIKKKSYSGSTFTPNHIFIFRIKGTKFSSNGINAVFLADCQVSLCSCMQTDFISQILATGFESVSFSSKWMHTFGFIPYTNVPFTRRYAANNQNWIIPPKAAIQLSSCVYVWMKEYNDTVIDTGAYNQMQCDAYNAHLSIFRVGLQIKHFQLVLLTVRK